MDDERKNITIGDINKLLNEFIELDDDSAKDGSIRVDIREVPDESVGRQEGLEDLVLQAFIIKGETEISDPNFMGTYWNQIYYAFKDGGVDIDKQFRQKEVCDDKGRVIDYFPTPGMGLTKEERDAVDLDAVARHIGAAIPVARQKQFERVVSLVGSISDELVKSLEERSSGNSEIKTAVLKRIAGIPQEAREVGSR